MCSDECSMKPLCGVEQGGAILQSRLKGCRQALTLVTERQEALEELSRGTNYTSGPDLVQPWSPMCAYDEHGHCLLPLLNLSNAMSIRESTTQWGFARHFSQWHSIGTLDALLFRFLSRDGGATGDGSRKSLFRQMKQLSCPVSYPKLSIKVWLCRPHAEGIELRFNEYHQGQLIY